MQQQFNSIEKDLKDIKSALLGSDLQPKGLIGRVDKIEEYQNKDRKQKWMFAGGVAVLCFLFNLWQRA